MVSFETTWNLSTILKNNDVSPAVQKHMVQTYAILTGLIGAAALGSVINLAYGYGNFGTAILGIVCLLYVSFTKGFTAARMGALGAFALFKGMSIGPLIGMSIKIDPSIVVTAFLATTCIFAAFSVAAMVATRRSYLYLGGALSSCMMILFFMSIASMFGLRSNLMMNIQLGLGLLVFMGYVIFDTQIMIEKASMGVRDPITDAIQLFIDFVAIFVRILIILSKMSEDKKEKR